MKVADKNGNVVISPHLTPGKFSIKPSRKAFETLSSGIYSDKVRAVIRELSTNAADSHKEAGQTRPFQVHLPNAMEAWFSVKDFGTGLSSEAVLTLYTRYFESNRTDSNDYTGCLGLGSKSPFSYVDQFSIVSRHNGMKYTYSCFLDKEGLPAITEMGKVKTTEENGLEVMFPVKPADFGDFTVKAKIVLQWFNPEPEILGVANFEFDKRDYAKLTNRYGLIFSEHKINSYNFNYATGLSFVVMGNVAYPFTVSDVPLNNQVNISIVNRGVDLFVDIGEMEIAASREKLAHTPKVNAAIVARLKEIEDECRKELEDEFDQVPTIWQARKKWNTYTHSVLSIFMKSKIMYRGQLLDDTVHIQNYNKWPSTEYIHITGNRTNSDRASVSHKTATSITAGTWPIFINDLPIGSYSRIAWYLQQNKMYDAYLMDNKPHTNFDMTGKPVKSVDDPKKIDFSECGVYEVAIKTSTLPAPPPTPKGQYPRGERTTLMKWSGDMKYFSTNYWCLEKDVKLADGGIYVVISRYLFHDPKYSKYYHVAKQKKYLDSLLTALNAIDKPVTLYGIRPADLPRLTKHKSKWVELSDYVQKVTDKHKNVLTAVEAFHIKTVGSDNLAPMKFFNKKFAADSKFSTYIKKVKEIYDRAELPMVKLYRQLLLAQDVKMDGGTTGTDLDKLREKTWSHYSLLKFLYWTNGSVNDEYADEISKYVRAIDKANE